MHEKKHFDILQYMEFAKNVSLGIILYISVDSVWLTFLIVDRIYFNIKKSAKLLKEVIIKWDVSIHSMYGNDMTCVVRLSCRSQINLTLSPLLTWMLLFTDNRRVPDTAKTFYWKFVSLITIVMAITHGYSPNPCIFYSLSDSINSNENAIRKCI